MLSVHIAPMQEQHAAALAELERLCFSQPRSEPDLRQAAARPNGRYCTALLEDGTIAGYAGMEEIVGECYVENIAVFPQYRRLGIGRLLTQSLLELAQSHHCDFITLEVRESNAAAIHLYQSLGFREEGRRKGFYRAPVEDGLIFTKRFHEEQEGETAYANSGN